MRLANFRYMRLGGQYRHGTVAVQSGLRSDTGITSLRYFHFPTLDPNKRQKRRLFIN